MVGEQETGKPIYPTGEGGRRAGDGQADLPYRRGWSASRRRASRSTLQERVVGEQETGKPIYPTGEGGRRGGDGQADLPYRRGWSRYIIVRVTFLLAYGHLWAGGGADPDGLDVDEFTDAKCGEFASVAAPFDSSKWQTRVTCGHAVNKDAASLDTPG